MAQSQPRSFVAPAGLETAFEVAAPNLVNTADLRDHQQIIASRLFDILGGALTPEIEQSASDVAGICNRVFALMSLPELSFPTIGTVVELQNYFNQLALRMKAALVTLDHQTAGTNDKDTLDTLARYKGLLMGQKEEMKVITDSLGISKEHQQILDVYALRMKSWNDLQEALAGREEYSVSKKEVKEAAEKYTAADIAFEQFVNTETNFNLADFRRTATAELLDRSRNPWISEVYNEIQDIIQSIGFVPGVGGYENLLFALDPRGEYEINGQNYSQRSDVITQLEQFFQSHPPITAEEALVYKAFQILKTPRGFEALSNGADFNSDETDRQAENLSDQNRRLIEMLYTSGNEARNQAIVDSGADVLSFIAKLKKFEKPVEAAAKHMAGKTYASRATGFTAGLATTITTGTVLGLANGTLKTGKFLTEKGLNPLFLRMHGFAQQKAPWLKPVTWSTMKMVQGTDWALGYSQKGVRMRYAGNMGRKVSSGIKKAGGFIEKNSIKAAHIGYKKYLDYAEYEGMVSPFARMKLEQPNFDPFVTPQGGETIWNALWKRYQAHAVNRNVYEARPFFSSDSARTAAKKEESAQDIIDRLGKNAA